MKRFLVSLMVLGLVVGLMGCGDSSTPEEKAEVEAHWIIERTGEIRTLNDSGRALFTNVLIKDNEVIVTYQLAEESLTEGKNLYRQTFDRDLHGGNDEKIIINVDKEGPVDWNGDLGDHKLVLVDDSIYLLAILKGEGQAAIVKYDDSFNYRTGPIMIGSSDETKERHEDMGFTSDGENLYAQFFSQPDHDDPSTWGAAVYRLNEALEETGSSIIKPESGSFVTGTSVVFVPTDQMGFEEERLQSFSTNRDYGSAERVGIQTFAYDLDLNVINGSTRVIIERELDTYFPVGPSWNETHQLWIVGYTMEIAEGEHGDPKRSQEIGPSFVTIFDKDWREVDTLPLNNGDPAFRVMTQTVDGDIYVVYDEMDRKGSVSNSRARIEHLRILSS